MARKQQTVDVDGCTLGVTSLDKVLYPETETTKAEVIEYLQQVAPAMLPHVHGRPVTRKRWPDGPGTAEEPLTSFFRKDLEDSAPSWVPRLGLQHSDHVNVYPLAEHRAVLAWFGQVGALELHVPQWRFDAEAFVPSEDAAEVPVAEPRNPDRLVLDLDPGPGMGLADCARVAGWCREILEAMGLDSVPVTSGSKGIHLYAQLDGAATSDQISQVAKELARSLETDHPETVVSRMKKSERGGKVFIDWSQNSASKTTIAPYSLRGRARPWVAAPRSWDEIDDPGIRQLEFTEVLQRLADGIDPLAPFASAMPDALEQYRSMRDAARTPEPVPEARPASRSGEPIFVIQEHHASRLHYDTRLERDGVLVSWAVPKGPPLTQGQQRLAVQTEDHPMEYATFEGTIPKGQYGAGSVTIWDSGTVEIEEWASGKVVFVLHGQPDGGLGGVARRYALVQTADEGKQWLIRMTKRQPDAPVKSWSMPKPLPAPMLASAGSARDIRGEAWVFEMKWDGYRMISAVHEGGRVELRSRGGKDYSTVFPELAALAALVPEGTVVDGEVVALDDAGRPDFGLLQERGQLSERGEIERGRRRTPVHLMLFDVLHTSAEGDVTALPYAERRELLRRVAKTSLPANSTVQVPDDLGHDLTSASAVSEELALEGVIAKRQGSTYSPGRRSDDWVKIKHALHADVVVIGWRQGSGSRASTFASLLLADRNDDGSLTYAGRVGTGFSERQLRALRTRLDRLERKTPPVDDVPEADASDATWVTPKLDAEVRHSGRTRGGRLRHPVWRTLK